MKIGIPKEIKNNENRVGMIPQGVEEFVRNGHEVYVEKDAGLGIGISNEDYIKAGAVILDKVEELFKKSTLIIKVKEPQPQEIALLQPKHILYTYLHLAADFDQTAGLMKSGATCIAYETVLLPDKTLPLLIPMSQVAGRMATQVAAFYLQKNNGGKGILPGGVPGTKRAKFLILGAGIAGMGALKMAVGLGADVTIMDIDTRKLTHIDELYGNKVKPLFSNKTNIDKEIKDTDVVIGTVLIPGAKAPKLITKEHLKYMETGSVMVDVAIDQGGCFESSKPTTHEKPVFFEEGILHYCVTNMPGAFPKTSTYALNNATLKYALAIANLRLEGACKKYPELLGGINIYKNKLVCEQVANDLDLPYEELTLI